MDTLYLVIVGAIGWMGFGALGVLAWKKHLINVQVLPIYGVSNPQIKAAVSAFESEPRDMGFPEDPTPYRAQTIIEPEIPEEIHRLADMAEPLLDQYDTMPQSGEWKRHQAYAAMLKNPKVKEIIGDDKWKAGFAIELAVAQRRMNEA